ncbi:MAG: amidohydrolase [Tannerella sp.]|jgi:5-methylthioadenosine/S-adenosylhomocysteine deaminase|nr:amidohydrolase [Tannerella sp.]
MSILIKSVELNGKQADIYIEKNRITRIVTSGDATGGITEAGDAGTDSIDRATSARDAGTGFTGGVTTAVNVGTNFIDRATSAGGTGTDVGEQVFPPADIVIDGRRKAVIPGLINMHTHAAMTLFRGFGDDMPLMSWLEQKIWPNEAKLTYDDVYWGAKLACVEMLRSGTTTFFDMYYKLDATAQAVEEMGLRAVLSEACFDYFNADMAERSRQNIMRRFAGQHPYGDRIKYALGPHAIYTVSGELLKWVSCFAKENGLLIQMHLAETEGETEQCIRRFGTTPVRYLHRLGILSPQLVLAHALYVDGEELEILAGSGVKVVHNPASNMKLASGHEFKYKEMREAGITVALGTDGCSSSNNLDMVEAMKLASLLGKVWRKDPQALSCDEMLYAATEAGADILGMEAGRIAEGRLADLCLVDLDMPAFTPNFNFVSNLVFAANGSCIDTVICDGRIVMQDRKVPGEAEIMARAARTACDLVNRAGK